MKRILSLIIICSISLALNAKDKAANEQRPGASSGGSIANRIAATCAAPRASKELWYNNVRTIIYSGGDMWWDLNGSGIAYYYVPAVQNKNVGASSTFAGSIWLGGLDAGGQLKVAAMTYRQGGIDFYPGPLDTINASADPEQCLKYDNIFTCSRSEVDNFVAGAGITSNILNWPGNGDVSKNQGRVLAPFTDVNGDGFYDPTSGDYPAYDVDNRAEKDNLGSCKTKLFGDYTMFWVFNDNGGNHTETSGIPIGVEVRAQAFVFKTNDEINNMTFYTYEIHNRSSFQLNSTYFTIWVDADLGYYLDDYVGCDVKRGLGYIYNADPYDETFQGTNGYGDFPPSFGCDFFKGPLADSFDGLNNDQDSITDEPGETIQMSRFTYYNNNIGAFPPQTTNPDIAIHYYNYMTGKWKDGSYFTTGGNAYGGNTPTTFVYDGDPVANSGWTERSANNLPGDRRFLQSAGPFTLKPGAVNEITFGMPWAQTPTKGGNFESLKLLLSADDKAQRLFDNCFKLLDGPEAPIITVQELSNELVIYLTNEKGKSNNYKLFNNDYAEEDISISNDPTSDIPKLVNPDKIYRFEGYIVYQTKSADVSSTDLSDPTKAIPIFQCDVANGHGRLINYEVDNSLGGASVPKIKVDGTDKGISSTFRVTDDAFSTLENRKLVNSKTYYFIAVAYAFNEFLPYEADKSPSQYKDGNSLGQKRPYLEGRKIKKASGIPHIIDPEKDGTIAQAAFGFGPKITREEGQGNGGNKLTITRASEDAIVANNFLEKIVYENAQGPINIKVVDPLNIKEGDFTFRFINSRIKSTAPTTTVNSFISVTNTSGATTYTGNLATVNVNNTSWELKDVTNNKSYYPNEIKGLLKGDTLYQSIKVGNEYYFSELGFSVLVKQTPDPGEKLNKYTSITNYSSSDTANAPDGSFIAASIAYENGESNWLNSIVDQDGESPLNWIHSGNSKTAGVDKIDALEDAYYTKFDKNYLFYDQDKVFGKVLGGTWSPYPLCASYYSLSVGGGANPSRIFCGPGFNGNAWSQDDYLSTRLAPQPDVYSQPDHANTDLRKMSSVLVVYSRDKSKWTRCPVLEMQEKSVLSEGNALFFEPRKHKSVNKNGETTAIGDTVISTSPDNANYISAYGMGWFPGYAINLETGERLNMAFGEDSYQKINNGNDMIWNPTSNIHSPSTFAMGGKHFVYVFCGNTIKGNFPESRLADPFIWESDLLGKPFYVGRYDAAERMMFIFNKFFAKKVFETSYLKGQRLAPMNVIERDIMWVSIPLPKFGFSFSKPDNMPSDVRMQINVAKPYRYGWSGIADVTKKEVQYSVINQLEAVIHPSLLTTDISPNPKNGNFPLYSFNTADIATLYKQGTTAKNALDLIQIVPNPYYGASTYEKNRIENIIRITNLPNKCTIKIFSMSGVFIRTIKRDVSGQEDVFNGTIAGSGDDSKRSKRISYQEWDLKNQSNITIASGLYIFHIDAPGVGEKILKWFGVLRPLDVTDY